MRKYDIAIIGSGFSGLMCGYILSKRGFKVAIFEKHSQVGGCLQTFERKGVIFDTGMHYIGSLDKGQVMHSIFQYLDIFKDVSFQKLDPTGFEHILFNNREYKFANGYEGFGQTLTTFFPDDQATILQYVADLEKLRNTSPISNPETLLSFDFFNTSAEKLSIGAYLDRLTSNPELQNVLSATNMLYAGRRESTPLYLHALITNFYIQSAWRIIGGANLIADSLQRSIQKYGGEVFTSSEVKTIPCDQHKATGLILTNGEVVEAEHVISSAHPALTLGMLDTRMIKKVYRERITHLEDTISNFSLFLEFKPGTVPYINYNVYKYNTCNVWDCLKYNQNTWPCNYLYMHQVPLNGGQYAESGVVLAYMQFEEVSKWQDTWIERRGTEYKQFKESRKEILLKQLERDFPGISNCIQNVYTSTPLTLRDYTGSRNGAMYGILKDNNNPEVTYVSHHTKIPNLYFTGQSISAHGILGVAISAIITSSEFTGLKSLVNEIFKP